MDTEATFEPFPHAKAIKVRNFIFEKKLCLFNFFVFLRVLRPPFCFFLRLSKFWRKAFSDFFSPAYFFFKNLFNKNFCWLWRRRLKSETFSWPRICFLISFGNMPLIQENSKYLMQIFILTMIVLVIQFLRELAVEDTVVNYE